VHPVDTVPRRPSTRSPSTGHRGPAQTSGISRRDCGGATIATAILKTPSDRTGCVVECGTFAGGSTANLPLVCALVGRDLEVFDSFEGLPQPAPRDGLVLTGWGGGYHAGQFSASLDDVRANVKRWGNIDVCRFHPGFFEQSMPAFARPCVVAFIDVDLRASAETCLRYLWPLLATDGHFYTHDAQDLHLASLFFDDSWCKSTGPNRSGPGGCRQRSRAPARRRRLRQRARLHDQGPLKMSTQPYLDR
jgi:hypothetical protein